MRKTGSHASKIFFQEELTSPEIVQTVMYVLIGPSLGSTVCKCWEDKPFQVTSEKKDPIDVSQRGSRKGEKLSAWTEIRGSKAEH